jgi:uncharacterized iron-regulated membrane protein
MLRFDRDGTARIGRFYAAAWRWHFYAGVCVLPFILVLALSGLAMLASEPVDRQLNAALHTVTPGGAPLPATALASAVTAVRPDDVVTTFVPPRSAAASAQFSVAPRHAAAQHGAHGESESTTVIVDPYTATILGELDPDATLYAFAKRIHGTLLLGTVGDYLIEIVAGFGVLLLATGLYLWWPREAQTLRQALLPSLATPGRRRWRNLHAAVGAWITPVLAFFLVSGLAWTPFWGGALVQTWSSLPAETFDAPLSAATHATLDSGTHHTVPWAVARTPLPASGSARGAAAIPAEHSPTLDDVVAFARREGLIGFRVHLPRGEHGVWTIASTTIAGDTSDPRGDRIVHLDALTGNVLGDVGYADYSAMGKLMAAGVPLHQADLGALNVIVNVLFCLAVLGMTGAAAVAWWSRRPAGALRLVPPPLPREPKIWRSAVALMLVVSLAFPLAAATIAAALALDLLLLSRVPRLKHLLE